MKSNVEIRHPFKTIIRGASEVGSGVPEITKKGGVPLLSDEKNWKEMVERMEKWGPLDK